MLSTSRSLDYIDFPKFTGTRLYMAKTLAANVEEVVPQQYQQVVRRMVDMGQLDPAMQIFVTLDEKELKAGKQHRRGGAHVDGNFIFDWGAGGGGGWLNGVAGRILSPENHKLQYQSDKGGFLLASNYSACQVWNGEVDGIAGQGGDCEHLRDNFEKMYSYMMTENLVHVGNSTCIHEGKTVREDVARQLIRITLAPEFDIDTLME